MEIGINYNPLCNRGNSNNLYSSYIILSITRSYISPRSDSW